MSKLESLIESLKKLTTNRELLKKLITQGSIQIRLNLHKGNLSDKIKIEETVRLK